MSLFINGDDFGMSKSCTLAIAEAIEKELIDGTTMMANGEYFDEAAALAASLGFAGKIGVHLNLTEGAPLTEEIKTVSAFVAGGRFHKEYLKKPCPLTEREQAAVFIELAAQIKRIRQAGINVIRADIILWRRLRGWASGRPSWRETPATTVPGALKRPRISAGCLMLSSAKSPTIPR